MVKGLLVAVAVLLCLCSCQTAPDLSAYVEKTAVEKQIEELKADYQRKLEKATKDIHDSQEAVIRAKNAQQQAVANAFYAQSLVFKTLMEPTRTDLILMNLSEEGWLAIGHLLPDYATMVKINERIAKELDAAKTTLADLRKNHDAVLAQNQQLVDTTLAKVKELADLEKARVDAETAYRAALDAQQETLKKANAEIQAKQASDLASKAARDAQIAKLSWGAGILAVACLLAALFSPVFKTELGIGAIVLGGAAAALPFLEPWHVLAGFGVVAAGLIVWVLYRHHIADKTTTALVNGLHEIETKHKPQYDAIVAPVIAEYTTKYAKGKDGAVVVVPDTAITKHVDAKLMQTDRI